MDSWKHFILSSFAIGSVLHKILMSYINFKEHKFDSLSYFITTLTVRL
jgi:hypothetical protein